MNFARSMRKRQWNAHVRWGGPIEEPKFPDDFKGWKPLYPMLNNRYLVLESPDGSKEACVHLEDNDVLGIKNKITGEDIYRNPKDARLELILLEILMKISRER